MGNAYQVKGLPKNILETQFQKGTHKECTLSLHVDCLEKYLHKFLYVCNFMVQALKEKKHTQVLQLLIPSNLDYALFST